MKASDFECQIKNCKKKAVVFVGLADPDATKFPYCRKHADEWKLECLIKMTESDKQV